MNSEFVRILKGVTPQRANALYAANELVEAHKQLFQLINKNQFKHNQGFLRYCKSAYEEIETEEQRIWNWYTQLINKDISGLDDIDREYHQEAVDYYKEILDQIDDTKGTLVNFLNYWSHNPRGIASREPDNSGHSLPSLEEVFFDKRQLEKLVNLLVEKNFANRGDGILKWTGIEHRIARGRALQLVALSMYCSDWYKKKKYQQKELHHAWTTYFNYSMSQNMFSESKSPTEGSAYYNIFNFLKHSITVK